MMKDMQAGAFLRYGDAYGAHHATRTMAWSMATQLRPATRSMITMKQPPYLVTKNDRKPTYSKCAGKCRAMLAAPCTHCLSRRACIDMTIPRCNLAAASAPLQKIPPVVLSGIPQTPPRTNATQPQYTDATGLQRTAAPTRRSCGPGCKSPMPHPQSPATPCPVAAAAAAAAAAVVVVVAAAAASAAAHASTGS